MYEAPPGAPLVARFEPDHAEGEASAPPELTLVLENRSEQVQRVHLVPLSIPQLAVDVLRDGQRVPPLPPPVPRPPSDEDYLSLEPGKAWRQKITLTAFSPPLPPGTYRVKAAGYPGAQARIELR